jgi:predicted esterase
MEKSRPDFVHRYLPAAPGRDPARAYTLLLLHGTGGDENDLLELGRLLAPGGAILSPRGKVLENGMPRFFRRLAEGVFDIDDLKRRTHELADFIEAAAGTYAFDPNRVIAIGFSNGANIAGSLLLLRPGLLAGAALLHPMVPFVPEVTPDLAGTPVFIGAGRADPIAPPPEAERLAALLESAHARVTLQWLPGGHAISHEEVRAVQQWLRQQRVTS